MCRVRTKLEVGNLSYNSRMVSEITATSMSGKICWNYGIEEKSYVQTLLEKEEQVINAVGDLGRASIGNLRSEAGGGAIDILQSTVGEGQLWRTYENYTKDW